MHEQWSGDEKLEAPPAYLKLGEEEKGRYEKDLRLPKREMLEGMKIRLFAGGNKNLQGSVSLRWKGSRGAKRRCWVGRGFGKQARCWRSR